MKAMGKMRLLRALRALAMTRRLVAAVVCLAFGLSQVEAGWALAPPSAFEGGRRSIKEAAYRLYERAVGLLPARAAGLVHRIIDRIKKERAKSKILEGSFNPSFFTEPNFMLILEMLRAPDGVSRSAALRGVRSFVWWRRSYATEETLEVVFEMLGDPDLAARNAALEALEALMQRNPDFATAERLEAFLQRIHHLRADYTEWIQWADFGAGQAISKVLWSFLTPHLGDATVATEVNVKLLLDWLRDPHLASYALEALPTLARVNAGAFTEANLRIVLALIETVDRSILEKALRLFAATNRSAFTESNLNVVLAFLLHRSSNVRSRALGALRCFMESNPALARKTKADLWLKLLEGGKDVPDALKTLPSFLESNPSDATETNLSTALKAFENYAVGGFVELRVLLAFIRGNPGLLQEALLSHMLASFEPLAYYDRGVKGGVCASAPEILSFLIRANPRVLTEEHEGLLHRFLIFPHLKAAALKALSDFNEVYPAPFKEGLEEAKRLSEEAMRSLEMGRGDAALTLGAQELVKILIYRAIRSGRPLAEVVTTVSNEVVPALRITESILKETTTIGMELQHRVEMEGDRVLAEVHASRANFFSRVATPHRVGDSGDVERPGHLTDTCTFRTLPSKTIVFKLLLDALVRERIFESVYPVSYHTAIEGDLRNHAILLLALGFFLDMPKDKALPVLTHKGLSEMGFPGIYNYVGQTVDSRTGKLLGMNFLGFVVGTGQTNIYDKILGLHTEFGMLPFYPDDLSRKAFFGTAIKSYLKSPNLRNPVEDRLASLYEAFLKKLKDFYRELGCGEAQIAQLTGESYRGSTYPFDERYVQEAVILLGDALRTEPLLSIELGGDFLDHVVGVVYDDLETGEEEEFFWKAGVRREEKLRQIQRVWGDREQRSRFRGFIVRDAQGNERFLAPRQEALKPSRQRLNELVDQFVKDAEAIVYPTALEREIARLAYEGKYKEVLQAVVKAVYSSDSPEAAQATQLLEIAGGELARRALEGLKKTARPTPAQPVQPPAPPAEAALPSQA